MAEFQEVTDPNDRADVAQPAKTLAELEAAMTHLLDIYNVLGVQWGADPFTVIQALKDRCDLSDGDVAQRLEDTLAELGLKPDAEDMTIARTIRELRARADKNALHHLPDSIPLFGYELVTRERIRQITKERWTSDHDDEHDDHSLAIVAAIYAVADVENIEVISVMGRERMLMGIPAWPNSWDQEWDKREEHPRLRQLSIAGALICAEIDRLQRQAEANELGERAAIVAKLDPRADL